MTPTRHLTSTPDTRLVLSDCRIGESDEEGTMLGFEVVGYKVKQIRLTDEQFLDVVRGWAERRGRTLTVRRRDGEAE